MKRWILSGLMLVLCSPVWAEDAAKGKPAAVKLTPEEKKILDLTNRERAAKKLPLFKVDSKLLDAARKHAENMAKQKMLNHVLDKKTPSDRVDATGYDYRRMAENISWGENVSLERVMKGWMESKVHRDNILNGKLLEIGIGYAKTEKGDFYCAQVFGTKFK